LESGGKLHLIAPSARGPKDHGSLKPRRTERSGGGAADKEKDAWTKGTPSRKTVRFTTHQLSGDAGNEKRKTAVWWKEKCFSNKKTKDGLGGGCGESALVRRLHPAEKSIGRLR